VIQRNYIAGVHYKGEGMDRYENIKIKTE